ncbi:MAG: hypothetical protein LBS71_00425 [Puniceicoccales bacterium]|jgi:hypothetical protein|nr:hypothetical protein [Puniceicoccales bacterium]
MDTISDKIAAFFAYIFNKEKWQDFMDSLTFDPICKWLLLIVVVSMVICYYKRRNSNRVRVHITDRGPVFMKKSALKNVVKKICHSVIPQSKSRVKIWTCCRKIKLRVSVACPYNVQPISEQLQQEITRGLKKEIGIDNLGAVHVVIEKIIGPIKTNFSNHTFTASGHSDNSSCCCGTSDSCADNHTPSQS